MAVSVAMPGYRPAMIDAVLKGLQAAHEAYGISQAGDVAKKLQLENQSKELANQTAAQESSPDSKASQLRQGEYSVLLNSIRPNSPDQAKQISALKQMVSGSPLVPAQDATTPASDGIGPNRPAQDAIAAVPGASATDLAKNQELQEIVNQQNAQSRLAQTLAVFQAKNGIAQDRLEEMKNKNSNAAGAAFEHDPILQLSKTNLNSLDRSQSILSNPNKPVTSKDLNLAYTDYINAVAAGGAATEGKIGRELPESFDAEWNNIKGKFGEFDDLRKDQTGANLIGMLNQNISTVRKDLGNAMENQALNVAQNFSQNTNPKVQGVVQQKLQTYAPNFYSKNQGDGGAAASSNGSGVPSVPSAAAAGAPPSTSTAPHPQDSVAVQWAKQNPKDPRSAKIIQLNGGQ